MLVRKVFITGGKGGRGALAIRIPKQIADMLDIAPGDKISIRASGDQIILTKVR